MTGGVGIAEEWTGDAAGPRPLARHARPRRGPVVRGLQGAFAENWLEATGDVLVGDRTTCPSSSPSTTAAPMQVVRSQRRRRRHERRGALLPRDRLRARARSSSPPRTSCRGRRSSRRCATRPSAASHVRVLVPGPHIDKGFVRVGGRAGLRASCWTAACGSSSTSRRCCTRRRWPSTAPGRRVGSVNFDNRSFQLHDEATLCVSSEAFAGELTEQFERDLEVSEGIEPERWRRRGRCSGRSRRV